MAKKANKTDRPRRWFCFVSSKSQNKEVAVFMNRILTWLADKLIGKQLDSLLARTIGGERLE